MEPKPGIYYHFKHPERLYRVIGVARNTETDEELVIYEPLHEYAWAPLVARPRAMFLEEVDRPEHGYRGPRFVFVREA